jgi:hypothetical protein
VGYRKEDGTYYQLDRSYDVITTPFGPLYSLDAEEFLLDTVSGVHDVVVVGPNRFPLNIQSTVVIVVPEKDQAIDPSAVLGKVRELNQFNPSSAGSAGCSMMTISVQSMMSPSGIGVMSG